MHFFGIFNHYVSKNCGTDEMFQKLPFGPISANSFAKSKNEKLKQIVLLCHKNNFVCSLHCKNVRTYPQKILGNFFQDFASNLTIAKILNIVRTLFEENKSSYSSKFKDTNIFQKSYFDAESKIFKVNCFLYGDFFFFSKIKRDDFIQSRHLISN